jgi:hypothetical protein
MMVNPSPNSMITLPYLHNPSHNTFIRSSKLHTMYTLGYSQQNTYCSPSTETGTMYSFGFRNKANTNMNSTAQYRQLDRITYDNRVLTTQESRFGSVAYDCIDMTTHDVRFGTVTFNNMETAYNSHGANEQKNAPHDTDDLAASVGEYVSAESSVSRILDDVMSVDTFPCMQVPLTTEDKIVNWLDIPLEITCSHANSNDVDNEEISLADSFRVDTTTRDSSRMVAHLFSPVTSTFHRQGQWHFDIESEERDEMSIDTVETWSLSEDSS